MGEFSISVDWSDYYSKGWENVGRSILEESCTHKTQDKSEEPETNVRYSGYCSECDISEDDAEPMMNYAYPLTTEPSEEDILKVVKNTCLTVMEKEGEYFLALCGGGMDLSQQIALAYVLIENWIPEDLISEVSTQKGLSVGGENWKLLRSKMIKQLNNYQEKFKRKAEEWENTKE